MVGARGGRGALSCTATLKAAVAVAPSSCIWYCCMPELRPGVHQRFAEPLTSARNPLIILTPTGSLPRVVHATRWKEWMKSQAGWWVGWMNRLIA
jgi:hypothetical protein